MTARVLSLLVAFTLAGCGTAPTTVGRPTAGNQTAALAAALAPAFEKALNDKYGALYTPTGGSANVTKVETYTIGGGTRRIRGIIEIKGKDFTAKLEAMAALSKADKVTADYFPAFGSATTSNDKADIAAAAAYAVRIQRMDRAQLGGKGNLGATVDPEKYTVKVLMLDAKNSSVAEVSYQSEGFMGKGSTFTEYYRVEGKRGAKTVLDDVIYNDNKATDPNGNDLDG